MLPVQSSGHVESHQTQCAGRVLFIPEAAFLKRLRCGERTKLLPIVVLTSSVQEDDVATSYALGANAYMRKPVDFMEFSDGVKALSRFWLVLNEVPPRLSERL